MRKGKQKHKKSTQTLGGLWYVMVFFFFSIPGGHGWPEQRRAAAPQFLVADRRAAAWVAENGAVKRRAGFEL